MDLAFGLARPWGGAQFGTRFLGLFAVPDEADVAPFQAMPGAVVTQGPNAQQIERAFATLSPNQMETKALRALHDNPGATGIELSGICGWAPSGWRMHMLVACHRRHNELWPQGIPSDVPPGFVLSALTIYEPARQRFWMRDELVPVLASGA